MKTIIISDIKGNSQSVIPYGLKLARHMESEAVVIHVADPRINQAKYSSYSDSQSLTPGEPHSHEGTFNKEITFTHAELDHLLSSEKSRMNYPLKLETIVKAGNLVEEIENLINGEAYCLVIANAEPDGVVIETKKELHDMLDAISAMCIMVPPGKEFTGYKKIVLPVNFDSKELERYSDLKFFFDVFDPLINAVSVTGDKEFLEMELKSGAWAKVAKDTLLPARIRINNLEGDDFAGILTSYINRNEPDLIMLLQRKKNPFQKIYKTEITGTLIQNTRVPVLYFFRK